MNYLEIIKNNNKHKKSDNDAQYKIKVLSNINVSQIEHILEYKCRQNEAFISVEFGTYNNIVEDSFSISGYDLVIIFYEIFNLFNGSHYLIELMDDLQIRKIQEDVESNVKLILENLQDCPQIIFNSFSSKLYPQLSHKETKYDQLVKSLDKYLSELSQKNLYIIQMCKIIERGGIEKYFDYRFFYSSKSPYTIEFFDAYSDVIMQRILALNGKLKKVLVLDCDNTLWGGVVGEDGINKLQMSTSEKVGSIYSEVQSIIKILAEDFGVILCLCSKNNAEDVEQVFTSLPDMILKSEDFVLKKINWKNKVDNIKEISRELNIGLDSIVFIDDSRFEIESIRNILPQVTAIKVPKRLYNYPQVVRNNLYLFWTMSSTNEDRKKISYYKQNIQREKHKNKYSDFDEYLASLELSIVCYLNDNSLIERISQMTQKTNQFNLTTKRYSLSDISKFVKNRLYDVIAISVSDKYGDNGVTGVSIIRINENESTAEIDSLLLSCRILGRNIEFKFMDLIIDRLKDRNVKHISAIYTKTKKNALVSDYYDKLGWSLKYSDGMHKHYETDILNHKTFFKHYIEVKNV